MSMYAEGRAKIKYHKEAFLNPAAKLSRDISVAMVAGLAKRSSKILDPTAATGIRGIRYYKETKSKEITLIDINKDVYRSLAANLRFNKVKAVSRNMSIQEFANTSKDKFDFIDFDPFGGVSTNIGDLMKLARSGTYFFVTATDGAVLCGAHLKACIRLYDARPLHNELCHEVGLRILIGYITRIAAQFNLGVEVLASFSYMHYMRLFLRLRKGNIKALSSIDNLGYVYYCSRCLWRGYEKRFFPKSGACPLCGGNVETAGKLWLGNLSDKPTIKMIQSQMSKAKMDKHETLFVSNLGRELHIPLFYSVPKFTRKLRMSAVSPSEVLLFLRKKGFKASFTTLDPNGIRSDASLEDFEASVRAARHGG